MNNSCLFWLRRAPPLPASHALFVVVLFSSSERAPLLRRPALAPVTKINFARLPPLRGPTLLSLYLYIPAVATSLLAFFFFFCMNKNP